MALVRLGMSSVSARQVISDLDAGHVGRGAAQQRVHRADTAAGGDGRVPVQRLEEQQRLLSYLINVLVALSRLALPLEHETHSYQLTRTSVREPHTSQLTPDAHARYSTMCWHGCQYE